MPAYDYKCRECGDEFTLIASIAEYASMIAMNEDPHCPNDPWHDVGRVYTSPLMKMPMPDHYNISVGRYVSGERDFRAALADASRDATERTGIEHNFKPIDLRDSEGIGMVPDETMDRLNRERHDAGRPIIAPTT